MPCRHVYEYVRADICPDCGRNTHEPDRELNSRLFKQYQESNNPLERVCCVKGAAPREWWSI